MRHAVAPALTARMDVRASCVYSLHVDRPDVIGAGRILKVEGHSGGSNYFGAPHFSVVPTQFLMELGAQPSKLNNSVTSNLIGCITISLFAK